MITPDQKEVIIKKLAPFHPTKLSVFGSYARNENRPESDLDLLVEFDSKINLFDIVGIELELSELLGVKVDLVTEKSISEYLLPYIEKDYQSILP